MSWGVGWGFGHLENGTRLSGCGLRNTCNNDSLHSTPPCTVKSAVSLSFLPLWVQWKTDFRKCTLQEGEYIWQGHFQPSLIRKHRKDAVSHVVAETEMKRLLDKLHIWHQISTHARTFGRSLPWERSPLPSVESDYWSIWVTSVNSA